MAISKKLTKKRKKTDEHKESEKNSESPQKWYRPINSLYSTLKSIFLEQKISFASRVKDSMSDGDNDENRSDNKGKTK